MASGKRSRERRRAAAAPPVRGKNVPRPRRASPRVLAIAAAIALAAVVGIVVAATSGRGGGSRSSIGTLPTNGSLTNALPGASSVSSLLQKISQHGLTLGSPSAPATLVEYIDLQCPFCQEFETQVLPDLVKSYVRTGKLKIEARVLDFIGPDSSRGRNAMLAAGGQGKAFDFAQILYDNQQTENSGWLDDSIVARAAESIPGLNPKQLFAARNSTAVKQQAAAIDTQATADDVTATPTLLVGKSGTKATEVKLKSPTDKGSVVRAITKALGS